MTELHSGSQIYSTPAPAAPATALEEARRRIPPKDIKDRSERSADLLLEKVITEVRPQIMRRLRQKGADGEALEDLCEETMERFIKAIHRREARNELDLAHPGSYALSVAETVFDDHLRRTKPNWCRLKRRILYLLDMTRAQGLFSRWKNRSAWIGGFARWTENPFRPNARYHAFCARPALFCRQELHDEQPSELPLPTLMAHLFRWIGTPLEVDELTTHLADLQEIHDAATLSLDAISAQADSDADHWLPPSSEDVAARVLDAMEGEAFRSALWEVICALPLRQRHALLLSMSSDELLLMESSGSIATVLALDHSELLALWPELPMTDSQIAQDLDITSKQVANLRKCARERIARNLKL